MIASRLDKARANVPHRLKPTSAASRCQWMKAPDDYRQRAEIARRIAEEMTEEHLREQMEVVTEEYDQMAASSETLRTTEVSDHTPRFANVLKTIENRGAEARRVNSCDERAVRPVP